MVSGGSATEKRDKTMTTNIETTDFIHATGNFMRSVKTITTESHDGWGSDALEAEHNWEVAKAEALGKIAENSIHAEALTDLLESADADFANANDMDDYQSLFEQYTAQLTETR